MPEAAPIAAPRVVVVGYRRGLCDALERLGVGFALWHRTRRAKLSALGHFVAPIGRSPARLRRAAEHLAPHGPFTHVIAGTESAVVPAAMLRRRLGARRTPIARARRCHDKLEMKRHLARHGISITDFRGGAEATAEQLLAELGSPVVVKARAASGGRGIVFARDPETLRALPRRGRYFERFVDGEEASVESFVHRGRIGFTSVTRYLAKGRVNLVPGGLAPELEAAALALNRRVIEALEIEWGMTHLEVFLTAGGILFGEIALRPPGGYIMELLDLAYGGDAWGTLVAVELDRQPAFPGPARAACAAIVLHPGAGTVRAVAGLDAVRSQPCVVDARVRVRPGDEVAPRTGVGQDVGRVLLRAANRAELLAAIEHVERQLVIEVDRIGSP